MKNKTTPVEAAVADQMADLEELGPLLGAKFCPFDARTDHFWVLVAALPGQKLGFGRTLGLRGPSCSSKGTSLGCQPPLFVVRTHQNGRNTHPHPGSSPRLPIWPPLTLVAKNMHGCRCRWWEGIPKGQPMLPHGRCTFRKARDGYDWRWRVARVANKSQ